MQRIPYLPICNAAAAHFGQYLPVDSAAFAAKHPALLGLASGALAALIGFGLFGEWWVVIVGVVCAFSYWLEASFARARLSDHVERHGWLLKSARWHPRFPSRQVRFAVLVERDGEPQRGEARVGGDMTGPFYSRRIELRLDGDAADGPTDRA